MNVVDYRRASQADGIVGHTTAFAVVLAVGVASTAAQAPAGAQGRGGAGAGAGADAGQAPAGAQGRGRGGGGALHTRGRSQGPAGRALQLDVAPGHAEGHRRTRHGRDARVPGQGRHDSGRRPAVHAVEVSREHQLPDLQPADSVHLHAREQADRTRTSRWSAGSTRGTRTRQARRSPERKARLRRCRRPCRSGSFASGPVRRARPSPRWPGPWTRGRWAPTRARCSPTA